jgi:multisubunit Na+/H+ antiporter MnhC subunit
MHQSKAATEAEQMNGEGIMDPLMLSVVVGAIVIGIAVAAVVFINKYAE